MEKVAIFVDVQNIYYTVKEKYRRHFNYSTFWNFITAGRQVTAAYAYAIDRGDEKQRQFQQILQDIGFVVKLKPYIQRRDGSTKGDWDVGITVDMLEYAHDADVIILASGDGDFDIVVRKIIEKYDTRVEVFGVPQLTAALLIESASIYHPIDENFLMMQ